MKNFLLLIMKWLTVQEYAHQEGICLAAAYKRVHSNNVESEKKFGRLLVKVKEKRTAIKA